MKEEKQLLLDEICNQINHYGSFLIMRYMGLTANAAGEFRNTIAKTGGNVEVVPKRVLFKAIENVGVTLDPAAMNGHIGLVFAGEDLVGTTKAAFQFSKDSDKALEIIAGHIDGQLYDSEAVKKLSKLPSKDEMRAQLIATLDAPATQVVGAFNSLLCSVIHCLENKSQQSS